MTAFGAPAVNLVALAGVYVVMRMIIAAIAAVALMMLGPGPAKAAPVENFISAVDCSSLLVPEPRSASEPYVNASFAIPSQSASGVNGRVEEVWIDLSLFDNDFASGTFIGAGPFDVADGTSRFRWSHLRPGSRHFYRLNALLEDGRWVEIGRGVFDTPDCSMVGGLHCEPGSATVQAVFIIERPPVLSGGVPRATWVDLSLFNNGFAPSSFVGAGPFMVGEERFSERHGHLWSGIDSGRVHYYRTNVFYDGLGWRVTHSGSFLSLDCQGLPLPGPPLL